MFGVGHPLVKPEFLKIVAIEAVPPAAMGLGHGDKEKPASIDDHGSIVPKCFTETFWYDRRSRESRLRKARGLSFGRNLWGPRSIKTVERVGRLFLAVNNAGTEGRGIDCYQPPINILALFRSST
jgi:hypothetical protein